MPFVFDNEIRLVGGGHRSRFRQIGIEKRCDSRSGGVDVVDDRLMGKPDSEEAPKQIAGQTGRKPGIDEEGQNQSDDMMGIVDTIQIDLGLHFRTAAFQIFRLEVVFAILIVKFVVRIEFLSLTFGFFLIGKFVL
ncbi:hypothetical protein SDC9_175185 [bioreactor metagenome]|uniref:Uncharacterized protein n=1 Tax=bioreactor metagenome TaxID=1076179 RepID=A0A645GLC3_9ZZZZ